MSFVILNEVKNPIGNALFGSVVRIYNAWLRSGSRRDANYVYLLNSSGGVNSGAAFDRYAVRPASSNAVNF